MDLTYNIIKKVLRSIVPFVVYSLLGNLSNSLHCNHFHMGKMLGISLDASGHMHIASRNSFLYRVKPSFSVDKADNQLEAASFFWDISSVRICLLVNLIREDCSTSSELLFQVAIIILFLLMKSALSKTKSVVCLLMFLMNYSHANLEFSYSFVLLLPKIGMIRPPLVVGKERSS